MKIILGKTAGFCAGVKNAVDKATMETNKYTNIYCLGELVHNKQVTEDLAKKGAIFIENIDDAKENVIIRAHGIPKETYQKAKELNLKVIDLTCPKVLQIHKIVEEYSKKGYFIFITGTIEHPEIVGTISFCNNQYAVIQDENDVVKAIEEFKKSELSKAILISQTTYSMEKFNRIEEKLKEQLEVEVRNTICMATKERQEETVRIAQQVDMMIIIGGKQSSNTNKLYDIAKKYCSQVLFIETADELRVEQIKNIDKLGIMAGASTPAESIKKIVEKIQKKC